MTMKGMHGREAAGPPLAQLIKGREKTSPRPGARNRKAGVSGNCSAGRHKSCYNLGCTCPCGHGEEKRT